MLADVVLSQNKIPYFASTIPSVFEMTQAASAESWVYTLPEIRDDDVSDTVTMTVSMVGDSASVLSYVQPNEIMINDLSSVPPGDYPFLVTLDDTKISRTYSLLVRILELQVTGWTPPNVNVNGTVDDPTSTSTTGSSSGLNATSSSLDPLLNST